MSMNVAVQLVEERLLGLPPGSAWSKGASTSIGLVVVAEGARTEASARIRWRSARATIPLPGAGSAAGPHPVVGHPDPATAGLDDRGTSAGSS
jgi:hypothetical protein